MPAWVLTCKSDRLFNSWHSKQPYKQFSFHMNQRFCFRRKKVSQLTLIRCKGGFSKMQLATQNTQVDGKFMKAPVVGREGSFQPFHTTPGHLSGHLFGQFAPLFGSIALFDSIPETPAAPRAFQDSSRWTTAQRIFTNRVTNRCLRFTPKGNKT